jgi:two-component system, OmpR family, response regulator
VTDELRSTIAEVWARHRDSACDSLAIVRTAVDRQAAGELRDGDRKAAVAEAHKLAGALGVYGYSEGSALTLRAERLLDGRPDDDLAGLLAGLVRLEQDLAAEAAS